MCRFHGYSEEKVLPEDPGKNVDGNFYIFLMATSAKRAIPVHPGKHVFRIFLSFFDAYIDEKATHRVTALAPGDG